MKNKYIRLKALLLAGALTLTGSTLTGCSEQLDADENPTNVVQETTTHFNPGEHIISVPIKKDIRYSNFQFDYYLGYEPIGISLTAFGKLSNGYGGGAIIYSNVDEVECSSLIKDKEGNPIYLDFGTPMCEGKDNSNSEDKIKLFGIGEHIISVPIKIDNRANNQQYEYHEGYEVVGIATTAFGHLSNGFGGGVLLYKNITPVECTSGDDGYTTFGVPVEPEKLLQLN